MAPATAPESGPSPARLAPSGLGYPASMTSGSASANWVEGAAPPAVAPHRVRAPVNIHRWDRISFLHWRFDPDEVARLVPAPLAVETFRGAAWVSLTPFVMRVRPPGVPVVPPGWAFPETNLRTYVRGPDGEQGLWFLRMEVTARWFVLTLRALGLPYFRQRMSVDIGEDRVQYRSRPGARGGGHHIAVRPGELRDPPHGDRLERFLTARWSAYHRRGPLLLRTPVEHPPWALRRAAVETCDVAAMFRDAGLEAPADAPLAHHSPGLAVKVGHPRRVA